MAGFDYGKAQGLALKQLKRYGALVEVRAYKFGGYTPGAGEEMTTFCKTSAYGISVPSVTTGYKFFDDFFIEEMTKGRAKIFILEAKSLGFVPSSGHFIVSEGAMWEIGTEDNNTGVMPLDPTGTPLIYTIGCRIGGHSTDEGVEVPIEFFQGDLRVL